MNVYDMGNSDIVVAESEESAIDFYGGLMDIDYTDPFKRDAVKNVPLDSYMKVDICDVPTDLVHKLPILGNHREGLYTMLMYQTVIEMRDMDAPYILKKGELAQ